MATEDFIWTGNWPDAREFMDRVGYCVPFLGQPAMYVYEGVLHVINLFAETTARANVGDTIRWYSHTRSFSVLPRG